jgi:hypothetical protein
MNLSLLAIDIGFDPRLHGLVRLALPLRGVHTVQHHSAGTCAITTVSTGTLVDVAESLARAGYGVVVCCTANGRDVQVTPRDAAPTGDGDLYGDICWAVQARRDNYWCRGASLNAALDRAGWTEADLRPSVEPT